MHSQLPKNLIESLRNVKGFSEEAFIAAHENPENILSIREHPSKPQSQIIESLKEGKVPWSSNGFYLSERPSFTLEPSFHAGAFYVQEASSMFVEQAIRQSLDVSQTLKVLDLCAAPGGKSTLLQSIISNDSFLVANEVIKTRVNILCENVTKWGGANVVVTNNDPKDFQRLPQYFDAIVVDAPCSGSGLFRRDTNAIKEWSIDNVNLCAQRQQRIIADVFPSLSNGGVLVYSTCSFSALENEAMMDWMMETFDVENLNIQIDPSWGIVATQSEKKAAEGYRFFPNLAKGEGFFLAVFKKNSDKSSVYNSGNSSAKNIWATPKEKSLLAPFVKGGDDFSFLLNQNEFIALTPTLHQELTNLQQLYIKQIGLRVGALIRNELIPNHALAVSNLLERSQFCMVNLDKETALDYLRKKDINLPETKKGWNIICYEGNGLGWAKVLPNRMNNYYPKEWRILNK